MYSRASKMLAVQKAGGKLGTHIKKGKMMMTEEEMAKARRLARVGQKNIRL